MNNKINTVGIAVLLWTAFLPVMVSANSGEACNQRILVLLDDNHKMQFIDTIPSPVKPGTQGSKPTTEKPVTAIIKQVPKARKVALPRPVTVKVKPVKVVKPRLIKPVLKVL